MSARPAPRWGLAGLGAALVLGAALRFWQLPVQSQFLDEAFTTTVAALPPAHLLAFIAQHDAHPPLFYLYAHAAVALLHWPPTWYRYLTAPFGLLAIFATWSVARRIAGDAAGTVAALFVATAPALVLFDRMFRMYGILAALAVTSFALLGAALDATGRRRVLLWILYGIVTALLPSIMYLGAFVVASQGVYALFALRDRWPVLPVGAIAALALIPWAWGIREQWPIAGYSAGGQMLWTWDLARSVVAYALPAEWYRAPAFDVVFTSVAAAVLVAGLALARGGLLAAYLLPLAIQSAATLLFGRNMIYGRYLVHLLPAFAVALGMACAALFASRLRLAGLLLVCAALAVNGVSDTDLLVDSYYQTSDWNVVERLLTSDEARSDAIVFDQGYPFFVMRTWPGVAGHDIRGPERAAEIPPTIAWIDRNAGVRVWYIQNQPEYPDPQLQVLHHLQRTRPLVHEWLEARADPKNMVYVALFGAERATARHPR